MMRSLKPKQKHGEWLIDHIYDLRERTRFQIFYDVGAEYTCEEDDIELEKGDIQYDERYE